MLIQMEGLESWNIVDPKADSRFLLRWGRVPCRSFDVQLKLVLVHLAKQDFYPSDGMFQVSTNISEVMPMAWNIREKLMPSPWPKILYLGGIRVKTRRLMMVISLSLFIWIIFAGIGRAAPQGASTPYIDNLEKQAVVLLNADRAAHGLPPLSTDLFLTQVARKHAEDMRDRKYFSHNAPEGRTPFDRLKAAGIVYKAAGENIAYNVSVERAQVSLMNSPGHRKNILSPDFTEVGIGIAHDTASGQIYLVQNFTGGGYRYEQKEAVGSEKYFEAEEQRYLKILRADRAAAGLPAFRIHTGLRKIAYQQAEKWSKQKTTRDRGQQSLGEQLRAGGIDFRRAAENSFMKCASYGPITREDMLGGTYTQIVNDAGFTDVGIGLAYSQETDQNYVVMYFIGY